MEARALTHRYGHRPVLDQLSFAFQGPGVVAVCGPNGSGKSTLIRVLAGLLRPSGGETTLHVDGRATPSRNRQRWIGYAGPDLSFYPEFTALENLTFAAEARGLARPAERSRERLEKVGLAARGGERVHALSSGMAQRLRLAFALLDDPPLLLLDEPGNHLDDEGRQALATLIREEGTRRLVMIATNDEREGALAGQRVELGTRGLGDPA